MSVVRWIFHDMVTAETVTLPYNPNGMTSPFLQQTTATTPISPIDGQIRAIRPKAPPREWKFTGFLRSQAHHDLLLDWGGRKGRMQVTDHLGRTFEIRFVEFVVDEKKPTKKTGWRLTYTMRCLTFGVAA